eukprot:353674-Chlamydomonas_euryale.AAC.4
MRLHVFFARDWEGQGTLWTSKWPTPKGVRQMHYCNVAVAAVSLLEHVRCGEFAAVSLFEQVASGLPQ